MGENMNAAEKKLSSAIFDNLSNNSLRVVVLKTV